MQYYYRARVGALAVVVGMLCGCAGGTGAARPASRAGAGEPSPVAVAALRERAWAVVEAMAGSKDARLRTNAMEACERAPARASGVLLRGLEDPNPAVRTVAATTAGKLRLGQGSDRLRAMLSDPSAHARASAIFALVRLGEDVDRSPLASALLEDPSLQVRSHAAYLLGELGDASAAPMLRRSLRQVSPRTSRVAFNLFQLQVAEALIKLGDESKLEPVRAALYPAREEDLEATALAVQILGEVRDEGAADQLIYLSAQRDRTGRLMPPEIRLVIGASLAKIGRQQGDFLADEYVAHPDSTVRAQAAYVYGQTGHGENLPKLEAMLGDGAEPVRLSAAAAILRVADRVASASSEPVP